MLKKIKDDFSLMAILIIPIGIAIDFIGTQIGQMLHIPIFLSSIGSAAAGMLAGPWVAMIIGVSGSVFKGVFNPTLLPFIVVTATIGLTIGYLAEKGMLKSIWRVIVSGIILTITSGSAAMLVQILVFKGFTGHADDLITATFLSFGFNLWSSVALQQFFGGLIDKIPTILIAFFIVKSMSSRYLSKFKLGHFYIKKQDIKKKNNKIN